MVLHSILYKFTIFQNFTFLSYNTSERQWFTSWAPITSWPTEWLLMAWRQLAHYQHWKPSALFRYLRSSAFWLVALKGETRKPGRHRLPHKNSRKKVAQPPVEEQCTGKQKKQKCSKMLPGKLVDQGFR